MIIDKPTPASLSDTIFRSCIRFARKTSRPIKLLEEYSCIETESGSKYYKNDMDEIKFKTFIKDVYNGVKFEFNKSKANIEIECTNCNSCEVTAKQLSLNLIITDENVLFVCPNCGEVLEVDFPLIYNFKYRG